MFRKVLIIIGLILSVCKLISMIIIARNGRIHEKARPVNNDSLPESTVSHKAEQYAFIEEVYQYIGEKCGWGEKMDKLNDAERTLYILIIHEAEVNNGGFSQFFFNSNGRFGNEIVSCYEKIGADDIAEICKKAISIYGGNVPLDWDERQEILTCEETEDDIEKLLGECDDAFYECENDLREKYYRYITENSILFIGKDVEKAKVWICEALDSSGYKSDFSIESLKDIDRFFDEQSGDDGIILQNRGRILFALGVYLGETIISNYGGEWSFENAEDETSIKVILKDGSVLLPVERAISRYKDGKESSVFAYAFALGYALDGDR